MSEIPRYRMTNNYGHQDNENGSWIKYEDHVAAMQAARPQPKFTVGDRVLWGKDFGTVTEPERESDRVAVSWDDGDYSTVRLSDVTLYVPPALTCGCPGGYVKKATAPESKFKVGNNVINTLGTIYEVTKVEFVDGSGWCYYSDEPGFDLECYVTLYVAPIPDSKFKIGDRVLLAEQPEVLVITGILSSQSVASDWSYDVCTTTGMPVTRVSASRLDLYVPPTPAELIPTLVEHEWVRGTTVTGESFEGYVIFNNGNTFGGVRILGFDYSTSPGYIKTIERCDAPEVK